MGNVGYFASAHPISIPRAVAAPATKARKASPRDPSRPMDYISGSQTVGAPTSDRPSGTACGRCLPCPREVTPSGDQTHAHLWLRCARSLHAIAPLRCGHRPECPCYHLHAGWLDSGLSPSRHVRGATVSESFPPRGDPQRCLGSPTMLATRLEFVPRARPSDHRAPCAIRGAGILTGGAHALPDRSGVP